MTATVSPSANRRPSVVPRVLPPRPLTTLGEHESHYGRMPDVRHHLLDEIERSGLRGRGGAGFPAARKLAAVAGSRHAVVVVNATEGEPASGKDKLLLTAAPHLVIDGALLVAELVGARSVHLCVDRSAPRAMSVVERAVEERARSRETGVHIHVHGAPDRYVAGEETALVRWLNGGEARPTFVPPRPFERGVNGRPTSVHNAETLSHVALIARHGAKWFRTAGTNDDPGTALLTVGGDAPRAGVVEIANGTPLVAILERSGMQLEHVSAVLVGGYFGTWLTVDEVMHTTFDRPSLLRVDASPGCGVVAPIAHATCGLLELARVTRWLASENAGQCGPCMNGLPAIATAVEALYHGDRGGGAKQRLDRWLGMVAGRGACKHPDGVVRFVRSGLRALAPDIERHRLRGPCQVDRAVLPVPATGSWR